MSTRFVLVAAVGFAAAQASAVVVPFVETFEGPGAAWSSGAVFTPLAYSAAGGPDGSGFGSLSLTFANAAPFSQPLLFRGQSNFNSSGNAFVGDWITSGVTSFEFSVRHNAPVPIDFFSRFAPAAGPGVIGLAAPQVVPNTWTTLTVAIDPANPMIIYEGTSFASFANIARVQVGIMVPQAIAGLPDTFAFDIDNVRVLPAPSACALMGLGLITAGRRRR